MSNNTVFARLKWSFVLMLFMLLDMLPVPVLGFVMLYVIVFRPAWFRNAVNDIYGNSAENQE